MCNIHKTIKQGHHYCTPFPFPLFKFFKKKDEIVIEKKVMFHDDCVYDIGSDQSDINKLFGISYGFHHIQSDRIGWRYKYDANKIELVHYSYVSGDRYKNPIGKLLDLNRYYTIKLKINLEDNQRTVRIYLNDEYVAYTIFDHVRTFWGYTLGLYFGGNCVAPHDMHITIQ